MSIEALEWVFKHSRSMGTPRTVLMVLAWHADSERGECWPGEALIAQESGLRRVRTVPDALRRLVELGEIQVIVNGGPVFKSGARAVRPNLYRIVGMSQGVTPTGDGMTPDARRDDVSRATGRRETRDGMTPDDIQTVIEPPPQPSPEPKEEPPPQPGGGGGELTPEEKNERDLRAIGIANPSRITSRFPVDAITLALDELWHEWRVGDHDGDWERARPNGVRDLAGVVVSRIKGAAAA